MRSLSLSLLLFLLLFSLPVMAAARTQGAGILRPSSVSKRSHELSIDPSLAGIRIGDNLKTALKKIGKPLVRETLGNATDAPVSYTNQSTGISVIATNAEGVGVILVTARNAGELDGIRVGDLYKTVAGKWGPPASGNNRNSLWLAGRYVISVTFDGNARVSRLGIGIGMNITLLPFASGE
jgi:hypothetical protein